MERPRILVTRRVHASGMDLLAAHADLDVYEEDRPMPRGEMLRRVRDVDGLLCHLHDRIDEELIAAAPRLRAIAIYAVGYNNIDLAAARRRGIVVTNTPGVLTEATADLTWALLLAAARRIPEAERFVRAGRFEGWGPNLFLGADVHGRTIGIVGMGAIGSAVARRARGFGMTVLYHNRARSEHEAELDARLVPLDELLASSDFVCLHVPLTEETHHLIGAEQLAMMKHTAVLVNVARGAVVDEEALVRALENGTIAGAALDVYEHEPAIHPRLLALDNVVLAPHLGSATVGTRERMAVTAATDLLAALAGQRPAHPVEDRKT